MDVRVVTIGNQNVVEGLPASRLLQSPDDAIRLVEECFNHNTRSVLLYAGNLTARFFDLSSGEAGAILQKLRNYGIRLAIVVPADGAHQSRMFSEMIREESRGSDFRVFDDSASAETWLAHG